MDKLKENKNIQIIQKDYLKALESLDEKLDIVFLDPPYATDFSEKACLKIAENGLLADEGIIIIETDRKKEVVEAINKLNLFEIYDERRYGRVELLFLKQK